MHLNLKGASKIMSMARTTTVLRCYAQVLLICFSLICGPWLASAQTTDSFGELTPEMDPGFRTLPSSEEPRENPQQAHTQEVVTDTGCSVRGFFHDTWSETSQFGHGLKAVPRSAVRPSNLKWELPILAATGVLIAKVDRPADNRIQSKSLQQTAGQWSNVGLGLERSEEHTSELQSLTNLVCRLLLAKKKRIQ